MFQTVLRDMLDHVDGSLAAMFLDHEGEAVETVGHAYQRNELKIIGAYQGIYCYQLRKMAEGLECGKPLRFKVDLVDYRIFTHVLKDGYYLVLVVSSHANEGTAWHFLGKCAEILLAEI